MGDRGNILIHGVYLYTHWNGSSIKEILQNVLRRKQRWDDTPYLTRMIFCEMVKEEISEETGYGISTEICDNQYNILKVDCELQKVFEITEDETVVKEWTFDEFIKGDI